MVPSGASAGVDSLELVDEGMVNFQLYDATKRWVRMDPIMV